MYIGTSHAFNSTIDARHSLFDRVSIYTARDIVHEIYNNLIKPPPYVSLNALHIYYMTKDFNHVATHITSAYLNKFRYSYSRISTIVLNTTAINISRFIYPCHSENPSDLPQNPSELPQNPSELLIEGSILHSTYIHIKDICIHTSNTIDDIQSILSHISSILTILTSSNKHNHALILTEGMILLSDSIDIDEYIAQFPPDFAAIQIFLTHKQLSKLSHTKKYKYIHWSPHHSSTRAYIINKQILLKYFHSIGFLDQLGNNAFELKLLPMPLNRTKHSFTCLPERCCIDGNPLNIESVYPCVHAENGIDRDTYLFQWLQLAGSKIRHIFPFSTDFVYTYIDW